MEITRNTLVPLSEMPNEGEHLLFLDEEEDTLELQDVRLWRCMFTRLGMKSVKMRGCRFLQSMFKDCYLREADFTNVDFTGSVFEDCDLERARFHSCSLRYTRFRGCKLNIGEMLETLPSEPNLKYQVLRTLEANERGVGHKKIADKLLVESRKARKRELWKRVRAPSTYYRERYGPWSRVLSVSEILALSLSDIVWGYGLRIRRLLVTGATSIAFAAAMIVWLSLPYVSPGSQVAESLSYGEALYLSALSFATLGLGGYAPANPGAQVISVLTGLSGAVFIGFLAASLFRRIAR